MTINTDNIKKQVVGQSLHLVLGAGSMLGVVKNPRFAIDEGSLASLSIAMAWCVAIVVHILGRQSRGKPALYNPNDSAAILIAVFITALPAASGLNHWAHAMFVGLVIGIGREILQRPVERYWDAALDIIVTTAGAIGGFFLFTAIRAAL